MGVSCYLNQFRPLSLTRPGRTAIAQYHLAPFLDASCRREPDFESEFPSITSLCRAGRFAPRLHEGDIVAYTTANFAYPAHTPRARRLVAVLRVHKSWRVETNGSGLQAHVHAAEWYQQQGLRVPSNCLVTTEGRIPLDKTDQSWPNVEVWDRSYRQRANKYGVFHACEPIFRDLHDPPRLSNAQLEEWFARVPGTQNPPTLPAHDFGELLCWLAEQTSNAASRLRLGELVRVLLQHSTDGDS